MTNGSNFSRRLLSFPFRRANKFPKHTTKKFPNHKSRLTNYTATITENQDRKRRRRFRIRLGGGKRAHAALEGHWVSLAVWWDSSGARWGPAFIWLWIRWFLMTPSGSVMAGIKALIPARTSATHVCTHADPATDGLTIGLHAGRPGPRWCSCTSLTARLGGISQMERPRGEETDVHPLWETEV